MPDPSITSWFSFYEKLATAGFGPLLFLVLVGSYFGIWIWGRVHVARETELKAQCAEERALLKAQLDEERERYAAAQAKFDARESYLQARLDQLYGMMIEAGGLLEKSAAATAQTAQIIERRRTPRP